MNAPTRSLPRTIDRAVYQFERWLAAALFLGMALVMFAHVLIRVFERSESKLMALYCWLARLTQLTDIRATDVSARTTMIAQFVTTFVVCYAGFRTMKPLEKWGRLNRAYSAIGAAAATGVLALLVYTLRKSFPNNIVGAPQYCLMAMLWVGFLGASIATYERRHLALEMGEKIWPKRFYRYVQGLAFLSAAAMTAFLARLAWMSLTAHYDSWTLNPLTGNLLPTAVPKWIVLTIFPYTCVVMSIRFLTQAGAAATGKLTPAASVLPVPGEQGEEAKS